MPKRRKVRTQKPHKKTKLPECACGEGLFDSLKRKDYSKEGKRVLNEYGSLPIHRITLSRAPISSVLDKALNVITFGNYDKYKSKYAFDKLFHLAMICEIQDRRVSVEKVATVKITTNITHEPQAQFKDVPIHSNNLSLTDMLDKTRQAMGDNFWLYNYATNNCQVFIDTILKVNGLLTPDIHSWLYQDVSDIQNQIGAIPNAIINGITDVGAVVNRITGQGLSPLERIVMHHIHGGSSSYLHGGMIGNNNMGNNIPRPPPIEIVPFEFQPGDESDSDDEIQARASASATKGMSASAPRGMSASAIGSGLSPLERIVMRHIQGGMIRLRRAEPIPIAEAPDQNPNAQLNVHFIGPEVAQPAPQPVPPHLALHLPRPIKPKRNTKKEGGSR